MLPMEAEMKLFYNRGCFLVVFLAVFLVACDGGPLKPSPPDNGGNGEGNGLETDSVPMLLRLKDADGQDTKMWVEVLEINPAPGSKIRVSSGCINPADCFRARVKLGFDGEVVIAYLEAFFSNDEVNPDGPHVFQRSQAQGSTEISLGPWIIEGPYKFLVFRGRYPAICGTCGVPGAEGRAVFRLNYL